MYTVPKGSTVAPATTSKSKRRGGGTGGYQQQQHAKQQQEALQDRNNNAKAIHTPFVAGNDASNHNSRVFSKSNGAFSRPPPPLHKASHLNSGQMMKGSKSENTSLHEKGNKSHRGMGPSPGQGSSGYHHQSQHGGGGNNYHHPRRGGHGNGGGYRGGHHNHHSHGGQQYHQGRGDQHYYHQHQGYHQQQQHHHQSQQPHHVTQQAQAQPQPPPQSAERMSPEYEELVRYVSDGWDAVKNEMDAAKKAGQTSKVVYYTETETNPNLRDFEPFDLEAWWGKRVYHNLTH